MGDQLKEFKTILEKFDTYFKPSKNVLRHRRTFYRRVQRPQEDTEAYLRALFLAVEDCEFLDKNERIRDQFVTGITNEDLAEKIEMLYFTKDGKLTLSDVIEYSRTYNDVHEGRKIEKEETKMVEEVRSENNRPRSGFSKDRPPASSQSQKTGVRCKFCGQFHEPRKCPAFGKSCIMCGKSNHFSVVCKGKEPKIDAVSPEDSSSLIIQVCPTE